MRPIFTAAAIIALIGPALASPVMAQKAAAEKLPKFYVYGEDDTASDLAKCKITHAAAITAVQAELRAKGAPLQLDSKDPEAVMDVYINIGAMPIVTSNSACTYDFELSFESFNEVPNPFTGGEEFTKLTYCSKGLLMIWDSAGAQAALNDKLREYARDCLAKYAGRNAG